MKKALWLLPATVVGGLLGKLLLDRLWWLALLGVLAWTALALYGKARRHFRRALLVAAALLPLVGGALAYGVYHADYCAADNSFVRSAFFQQSALVLVPHQDDELNIAASAIRCHVEAGGSVTVAFSTNGDYAASADERVTEALNAAKLLGVTDVRLLGYGDSPLGSQPMYTSDGIVQSNAGHTQTYGAAGLLDERARRTGTHADYTSASLLADLSALIDELRPQVIYVTELDGHPDHQTLSLLFDRAMGTLLRETPDYQPMVLKALAYETAWTAHDDFYQLPWKSALQACFADDVTSSPDLFWSERVRFPVPSAFRAYTLRSSDAYALLACYAKRGALDRAGRILNSDEVFWRRRTDNLALHAEVSATTPNAELLTDFMLSDRASLTDDAPITGCWYARVGDSFTLRWSEPQTLGELRLLTISPTGDYVSSIEVYADGALCNQSTRDAVGAYSVDVGGVRASELRVVVTGVSGASAGFTEAEAFAPTTQETQLLKLIDYDGNFLYEYAYEENRAIKLRSYAWPNRPDAATATLTNADGTPTEQQPEYVVKNGRVKIPALRKGVYRLTLSAGDCSDEIVLRVGDTLWKERLLQSAERVMERASALWSELTALVGL